MTIPFEARVVDLVNLVIAKGSNFVLTAILFALISHGMDQQAFGEFGYWWSVAIMIGGMLLGGMSSGLIRVAAVHGSLLHLVAPMRRTFTGLLVVVLVWTATMLVLPDNIEMILLFAGVGLFGLFVQAQTVTLALLRAAEASRANLVASVLIVVLVPLSLYFLLGTVRKLDQVFLMLACAFALGTLVALACSYRPLRHLFTPQSVGEFSKVGLLSNASSFTAVNIFSYAAVNIDFTIFRLLGTADEFAVMATGKVFFERFVVPGLLVFAGAVSLRVLRYPGDRTASVLPKLHLSIRRVHIATAGLLVLGILAGYWWFANVLRADATTIPPGALLSASLGYVVYAFNAVLLDILVIRRNTRLVATYLGAFLVMHFVVQFMAIQFFSVTGWAVGWLFFNLLVLIALSRECISLRKIANAT